MGRDRWFAGTRVTVHVTGADSDGRLGIWESDEPRGSRLPLHVHRHEDEQVVVLSGEVTFEVGDRTHRLASGDTLALPRGVPHRHVVTSPAARLLTVATPAGFESLFTSLGIPVTAAGEPPSSPSVDTLVAAVGQLGVEVVGPPLPAPPD